MIRYFFSRVHLKKSYILGSIFMVGACIFNVMNDALLKKLGGTYGITVLFFRFLFSTLFFLPVLIAKPHLFFTKNMKTHMVRGGLFSLAMIPWSYGIIELPLTLSTLLSFTIPLFVLILAKVFLKEHIGYARWIATCSGFLGILIGVEFSLHGGNETAIFFAILATLLFAILDIMNKRLLTVEEPLLPMMFFSSLWTSVFSAPLALYAWRLPAVEDIWPLMALGFGANALLACLLLSFRVCDVSALQPLRYIEFILSCAVSIIFFHTDPDVPLFIAMGLIMASTFFLARHEVQRERQDKASL